MKYEYGYIITIKGKSKEIFLGECSEAEYPSKKKEIDSANHVEREWGRVDGRGRTRNKSVYFIKSI